MKIYAVKQNVTVTQIVINKSSMGFLSRKRYISTSQKVNYEIGYESLLTFKLYDIKRNTNI
jgi:hypothetical protein